MSSIIGAFGDGRVGVVGPLAGCKSGNCFTDGECGLLDSCETFCEGPGFDDSLSRVTVMVARGGRSSEGTDLGFRDGLEMISMFCRGQRV